MITIEIAYIPAGGEPVCVSLSVSEETSIADAVQASALLERFSEIDLSRNKVGVFGKLAKPHSGLSDGDRIEIYRPIVIDPKTVPRRAKSDDDDDDDADD